MPAEAVDLPPLRALLLVAFLCLAEVPAVRGATVLLGERLEAPTFVALAAGPGIVCKGICFRRLRGEKNESSRLTLSSSRCRPLEEKA